MKRWPTDMRATDTRDQLSLWSDAVSPAVDSGRGDVDIATHGSTPATRTMPGCRTSATATRTTTTRTTSTRCAPSADDSGGLHAEFSFADLAQADEDCRRAKRNTVAARRFEFDREANLRRLFDTLRDGTYRPAPSTCFVILRPKKREVWAADYPDRVVHHLLYNKVAARFHGGFIADSCACIPGRGTLYAARRLDHKVRSVTQNWARPAHYLKCDIANFFVSIDKNILRERLARRIHEPWWMGLADLILFHDPRPEVRLHSAPERLAMIPPHKSLFHQPAHLGLPIGNLSSQFFANVYLDALDQFVKHRIRARHYVRYVDDFILLHESPQWLNRAAEEIDTFLQTHLAVRLNQAKTIRQPIERGIDMVGQVIKPWRTNLRRRTYNDALHRATTRPEDDFYATANSYFGLLRQCTRSHHDRARLARIALRRGFAVERNFTKVYRKAT